MRTQSYHNLTQDNYFSIVFLAEQSTDRIRYYNCCLQSHLPVDALYYRNLQFLLNREIIM
jgi:hypothetical protein